MKFLGLALRWTTIACIFAGTSHASYSWDAYAKFASICGKEKRNEANCTKEILRMLEADVFWGDSGVNYFRGRQAWPEAPLTIQFNDSKEDEGDFAIVGKGKKLRPKISLSRKSDPFELMITINHEIVHFGNSEVLRKHFSDKKRVKDCLTPFELALLENERLAFLSEVYFWKTSPAWFKNEMKRFHFNSKLLGADRVTYKDYYERLEKELSSDRNFVAKRYVELGKFPKCAVDTVFAPN